MTEQLHDTREAGKMLGGMHPNDVLRLIRAGRLNAKKLHVRGGGTKPRNYIVTSEIQRFISELPDALERPEKGGKAKAKTSRARHEKQAVTEYYQ